MAEFKEFKNNDTGFKRWLRDNRNGFVLNGYNTGKIHTASCTSYQAAGPRMTYTRRKVCSTSERELLKYAKREGWEVPLRCQLCF
jgi:hypothetical protein